VWRARSPKATISIRVSAIPPGLASAGTWLRSSPRKVRVVAPARSRMRWPEASYSTSSTLQDPPGCAPAGVELTQTIRPAESKRKKRLGLPPPVIEDTWPARAGVESPE